MKEDGTQLDASDDAMPERDDSVTAALAGGAPPRPAQRGPASAGRGIALKYLIPNAVTLANITLGFLGILAAAEGHFSRAVSFLFAGALCDLADGRLARMLGASSSFGRELDSLSDMVSFGIAPAVLVYLAVLNQLGAVGLAIAAIFPLAGAVRLARYNIDTDELGHVTFVGMPIPVAAGYLWSFVIVGQLIPAWLVAAGVVVTAGLMVSRLKIPKFRRGGLPAPLMVVALGTFVVFWTHPSTLTWHIWNTFNLVLVALNYGLLSRRGLLPASAG